MTLTRGTWLYLGALWLALAVVLSHALVPLGPSLQSRSGSAFSAFTSDVALGPERGDEAVELRRAADDRDVQPAMSGGKAALILASLPASAPIAGAVQPRGTFLSLLASQASPQAYNARAPPRA